MERALAFRNSERLSAVGNHELTSMKDLPDGDEPKRVDPLLSWGGTGSPPHSTGCKCKSNTIKAKT